MKTFAVISITFWIIGSLYFGIGGIESIDLNEAKKEKGKIERSTVDDSTQVIYEGIIFQNKEELGKYLTYLDEQKITALFFWIDYLSDFGALLITACFFGMLGACINLILRLLSIKEQIEKLPFISLPVLGFLSGLVILGLTYILPEVLAEKTGNIRPITLMFLCLFSGIFTERFYKKLNIYFSKVFK